MSKPIVTPLSIRTIDGPCSDQQRSQHLFAGELLIFRQLPTLLQLNRRLQQTIRQRLGVTEPSRFLSVTATPGQRRMLTSLQEDIRRDSGLQQQFYNVLREVGVDDQHGFSDRLQLRIVGPQHRQKGRDRGSISHHRDTWGSNIQAQINWWTPLYPVNRNNTIAFYPDYWDRPLANTSADWSFKEFLARRARTPADQPLDYPYAPQPLEALDCHQQQPLVIEPGDLLCFASAHLHGSTVNTTGRTRFSLEMRTVQRQDLSNPAVPENLDNAGTTPMYGWFRRLRDQIPLSRVLADSAAES